MKSAERSLTFQSLESRLGALNASMALTGESKKSVSFNFGRQSRCDCFESARVFLFLLRSESQACARFVITVWLFLFTDILPETLREQLTFSRDIGDS